MRRKSFLLPGLLFGALVLAEAAGASNGGISPVTPVSPNAHRITDAWWLLVGVTGVVLVAVEATLVTFIWRYRRRGRARTVEGSPVEGHTRLEIAWTVAPVLLLAVIVAFVFYKLPGIKNAPAATSRLQITVEGHQFYWLFKYPDGSESINTLTVPVNTPVELYVVSPDVVHSWWVPAFGGKIDAIPGKVNRTWFQAEKTGSYAIRCAEFCGFEHAKMTGVVNVVDNVVPTTDAELGRQAFEGVCATCHGGNAQGDVGPAIAASPTLGDPVALARVIHEGIGRMPAVGSTWDDKLTNAAVAYLQKRFGGQGGG